MDASRHPFAHALVRACVAVAAASATLTLAPAQSHAESIVDRAKRMSDDAARLFRDQRYPEAAELFEQAFALDSGVIVRLRNAGRAWEEAGRPERAVHCFTRYLELETDAALRKDAEERVAANRAKLAPTPAPVVAPSPPQVVTKVVVAPSRPLALPLTTTIGSAAILATGALWLRATASAEARIADGEAAGTWDYPGAAAERRQDQATVDRNRVAAYATLGLGVAGAGVATWLWLRPIPKAPIEVAPAWLPGGGSLVVTAAF